MIKRKYTLVVNEKQKAIKCTDEGIYKSDSTPTCSIQLGIIAGNVPEKIQQFSAKKKIVF